MTRFLQMSKRFAVAGLLVCGLGMMMPTLATAQDEEQKNFITNFVQDRLSTPERQIRLSNIEGILGSDVAVREITISD